MALDLIFAPHSLLSKSLTKQERTKISALFREIESFVHPASLLNACAMPLPDKSGAGAVVALQSSECMLMVTTPFGMLLLSLDTELDVSTVVSLMSFIKERTEGARDTMGNVHNIDNPISADQNRLEELEDQEKLLYSLREIAETSEDAESVRVAFIALTTTDVGTSYIRDNPIKL